MRHIPRVRNAGMSLVEVVITLAVFVVAGLGIVGAHFYSNQLSEYATSSMRAVNDLEDIMERIHATPFDNLQATFPAGVPNGVGNAYAAIVGGYTLGSEQITVTYPSVTTGRLEMVVTVNWTERLRQRSTSLSTVRTSG